MITLRLLGGAKKAIGKQSVELKTTRASIADILAFLKEIAIEPHLLERANLIIAINGIDSSALGENPIAKEGDTVTIVPVVHGGSKIDCSKNPSSRWQVYSANIKKHRQIILGKIQPL
jgi:sulfur-carrier protein